MRLVKVMSGWTLSLGAVALSLGSRVLWLANYFRTRPTCWLLHEPRIKLVRLWERRPWRKVHRWCSSWRVTAKWTSSLEATHSYWGGKKKLLGFKMQSTPPSPTPTPHPRYSFHESRINFRPESFETTIFFISSTLLTWMQCSSPLWISNCSLILHGKELPHVSLSHKLGNGDPPCLQWREKTFAWEVLRKGQNY